MQGMYTHICSFGDRPILAIEKLDSVEISYTLPPLESGMGGATT